MKLSLIDLVQTILAAVDGDEVNNINDTVESQQIAMAIRSVYFDIVARSNLPELNTLFQLEASTDSTKPTLMTLPTDIATLDWIKYDCQTIDDPYVTMKEVSPLPLKDFIDRMYQLDVSESYVDSFVHDNITFVFYNDRAPMYWTSYDDKTVVFDAYDNTVDTTLQKAKSLSQGRKNVEWRMENTFIPVLDDDQFPLLLNEAKSIVFTEAKQIQHPIAERNSQRGWFNLQKSKNNIKIVKDFDKLPYFGRK